MATVPKDATAGVANTLTVKGVEIPVESRLVEQTKLRFFADNPRIYSIIHENGKDPTQEEIQQQLLKLEHVRALIVDIKDNGGLTDPLVVIDGSFQVVEGNSRLAAYRHLAKLDPIKWGLVKCTMLPNDIDHSLLFALLGQYHIKGKKDWLPYEQAGFLYRRFKDHHVDVKSLAAEIGLSARRVKQLIDTYQFMLLHEERDTDRWSYYDEYLKSSKIRKARAANPEMDDTVVAKVRSGEICRAVDIRDALPVICTGPAKLARRFALGALTFQEAHEIAVDGGGDSVHLRRLTRFRRWLVDEENAILHHGNKQVRDKIVFELGKIATKVDAVRKKLEQKAHG